MKKLLATAVTCSIFLPVLSIAGGPTIYGKLHMAIGYNDNNTSINEGTPYSSLNLASRGSRIGVKGGEDLGNGLKAGYLIEWGVGMDGGKDLNSRNRGVTLSGGFGTGLVGKWDTPLKTLGGKLGVFRDTIGDVRNLGTSSSAVGWTKIGTIDQRAPNVIAYITPNLNGFSSTLAYVADYSSATTDNTDTDAFSANVIYKNGPIFVGAAFSNYSGNNGADDAKTWRIGGSYKIAGFKVTADYTDMNSANFIQDLDPSIWRLAGTYTMGSNTFKIQYANRDESGLSSSCTGGLATSQCQDGADMWAIGFDHKMSKRTKLYLAYAHTSNDGDSSSTSWKDTGGEGIDPALGNSADAYALGIIHKF